MKRPSLGLNLTAERTGKREFLARMEREVTWPALVELVASLSGLRLRFVHTNYSTSLQPDQKLFFYRILQEQLTNITRHAAAMDVRISLSQANGYDRV